MHLGYCGIPGWFNFHDVYRRAILLAPRQAPAHFVEVGALFGASTAFMSHEIDKSGKEIHFDTIDVWDPQYMGDASKSYLLPGETPYGAFERYMSAAYADKFRPLQGDSLIHGVMYNDNSLDFVFLDGLHKSPHLDDEVKLFMRKIRPGGILAGHDLIPQFPDVGKVVIDSFGENFEIMGTSWWTRKPML